MNLPRVRIIHPDGRREFISVQDAAAKFAVYSILCANAYAPSDAITVGSSELGDWLTAGQRLPIPAEWRRCGELEKFAIEKKKSPDLADLNMEVWMQTAPSSGSPTVVLVIRGTAELSDWLSNLNWLVGRRFPHIRDKYARLRSLLSELIPAIKSVYPDANLIATGHSLGGGLAQFSAYAYNGIKTVYAFDSSPVTGYFILPKADRRRNKQNLVIYRVNERGAILALVRGPIRFLINIIR